MNKELTQKLAPGHTTCAGCGIPAIVRTVLSATDESVIVVNATGCLEVTTTVHPFTAWKVPYIHNAFENAAATASGVEAAIKALRKKVETQGIASLPERIKIIVFAGDGGTYDIGLQALSGMLERGHEVLCVCYDNQGYMNTGGQRSGASPYGANTKTTPSAKDDIGNEFSRKDIMRIVAAHNIQYLAQGNVAYLEDLKKKAKKALAIEGPSFLLVFQPCNNEWKFPSSLYIHYGKLATETNFWPLYEIENGKYIMNLEPKERKPIEEFLKGQGRFKHLFLPENEQVIEKIQRQVDEKWEELKKMAN